MRLTLTALAGLTFAGLAAPAFAQDIEAGAKTFNQCQTCHVVQNEAGETLAGKNAKTGPNLYGVVGRVAGSLEGFKYGAGIEELKATGYVWTEADLAVYVQDPTKFLVEKTGDKKAKSKMMFKLKKEEDAKNVVAFLASLAPAADAAATDAAAPAEGAVTE
ncbi:MAG: cytochrome C [Tabrizicola sp.]|uniref:c-type cytochrome n=1 Tax=Tabrizicola sp. TaxID=2005166 RepID=UPI00273479A5|nr:c-type cytochrome [Tabrizicola sp.]MDP3265157.1 cytochrome C [Tabrizicola sp.]MDP3646925.1 cytochrome C [Paracoccaceae bacterium]MDZ4069225.1 cytochrome C [Tabrizicola sp.]